jgi:hypothetical protein
MSAEGVMDDHGQGLASVGAIRRHRESARRNIARHANVDLKIKELEYLSCRN